MKRRTFIETTMMAGAAMLLSAYGLPKRNHKRFKIRLLRHATLLVEVNGLQILVDPMLSKKEALDPIANAANSNRIPMVDLPLTDEELSALLADVDAVLITHTHRDHWDIAAQNRIPKDKVLFCQPSDEKKLLEQGFTSVHAIPNTLNWKGISFVRTNGQHGTGNLQQRMGAVSGYVINWKDHRLYIAGDTIWCTDVADAIREHQPTHIIVNGGGAQFVEGDPITMTIDDILKTYEEAKVPVTVVHLESVNHCYQKRAHIQKAVTEKGYNTFIKIPNDGDIFWAS